MRIQPGPGRSATRSAARKAKSKALVALAPYLVPVLILVLIISVVGAVVLVAITSAIATQAGAEAQGERMAMAEGLPADRAARIRAAASSQGIPWQILGALHAVHDQQAAASAPVNAPVAGVTPADGRRYAQELLDRSEGNGPRVTIQQDATRAGLRATADGEPTINSCGEQMILSPLLLGALVGLTATKWKVTIDDFGFPGDRGYCETGTFQHPKGNAVDLQGLVNLQTGQSTSPGLDFVGADSQIASDFATDFLAALPGEPDGSHTYGGIGQKQCGVNPSFPADSQLVYTFDDSCDHLHVDVRNRTDLMESALTKAFSGSSGGTGQAAGSTSAVGTPGSTTSSGDPIVLNTDDPRVSAGSVEPARADQVLAALLATDMAASYGRGRISTLVDGAVRADGGATVLTFPARLHEQAQQQRSAWVAAIGRLPVAGNSDSSAGAVYDLALRWALIPRSACGGNGQAVVGGAIEGGLSSTMVPEPMRSEMIRAAQAYGVPPGVIAALYLTENNGFSFAYAYYDGGSNPSAFTLTTTSSEWKLATYGTTGLWPAGGTFRGPFQFGPIWGTYRSPEHPDVLLFADAAFGAAHYMADLGAKDDPGDDAIDTAAQGYNGQISWSPGGSQIRNPDPAKFSVVKQLYAFQVVQLAKALSVDDATAATPPSPTSAEPNAAPATTLPAGRSTDPIATGRADQPSTTSCAETAAAQSIGVDISTNGVDVSLPDDPNIVQAARGKTITAPSAAVASGLAAGLRSLGLPYVWGGGNARGPDDGCVRAAGAKNACQGIIGFDCSGLTAFVLGRSGAPDIPGTSGAQRAGGVGIPWDQAQPGDIIGYPGHVAIYLGTIDGVRYQLEAPDVGLNVRVTTVFRTDADTVLHRYWTAPR
ncbi:C40 family peptidase [Nakamurella multipartita]|uniref:NLP/P60 protein n=1 Tax=Nakamurella multipartita (strain ATCC 700099 / DSM 44233 / CIP 104796 / JCM 9543 / NBRC 105858 / Y-104) TaxID=479431 RepID=C8X8N4_NAKMY|nr:NlpC/P60 family protein [Nakamurella multipartita]ACV79089.1 NLP/P60 protein [Nakamurella multipartita DSM 44233]